VELQEDKTGGKQPTSFQLEANKFENTISKLCIFFSYKLVRYCLESLTYLGFRSTGSSPCFNLLSYPKIKDLASGVVM
jgi:hypothetical protein